MFRYFALVWNEVDPQQAAAAERIARRLCSSSPGWIEAIDGVGLRVFHVGTRAGATEAHVLTGGAGVVLGTLFEKCTSSDGATVSRKASLSCGASERVLATQGRLLVEHYWGRYVAFLRDPHSHKKWILRDPTGGLPCLTLTTCGVRLYFSCLEDCVRLQLMAFSINWDYIAAQVVCSLVECRETALNEVSSVLAGERVETAAERVAMTFCWNAFDVARRDVIESVPDAVAALRRTARDCVHAWAACHSSILVRLSGGLDSSIVVACLRDAPSTPRVICLNYYSDGSDSDERAFARLAAGSAGFHLVEWERSPAVRLDRMVDIAHAAIPGFYLGCVQMSEPEARLARENEATAIAGGAGGDQLFYQHRASLGAADYARRHGIDLPLLRVALDAAHLEQTSIWSVLRGALHYGLLRGAWDPLEEAYVKRDLVKPELIDALRGGTRFTHPWLRSDVGIPPGKLWHIFSLSFPHEYYDPMARPDDPERVYPLCSQPLIELCLRIPTYVLTTGGWDRSIARRAFAADVPREILRRRTKGGLEEHAKETLMRNIAFARELLLDGSLVERGLLDRERLAQVLSGRPTRVVGALAEIYEYLSIEVWLRSWNAARQRAAA